MNDLLTISFEHNVGKDFPMMIVSRVNTDKSMDILSVKMDEEAEELYRKLVHP